jgi:hypothetical protein
MCESSSFKIAFYRVVQMVRIVWREYSNPPEINAIFEVEGGGWGRDEGAEK